MVAKVESEIIGRKRGQQRRVGPSYHPVGDSRTLACVLKTEALIVSRCVAQLSVLSQLNSVQQIMELLEAEAYKEPRRRGDVSLP